MSWTENEQCCLSCQEAAHTFRGSRACINRQGRLQVRKVGWINQRLWLVNCGTRFCGYTPHSTHSSAPAVTAARTSLISASLCMFSKLANSFVDLRNVIGHSSSTAPLKKSLIRLPQCATVHNQISSSRSSQICEKAPFSCVYSDMMFNTGQPVVRHSEHQDSSAHVLRRGVGDQSGSRASTGNSTDSK